MSKETTPLSPVTVYVPVSKHTGFAKCFQHGGSWFHSINIEEQERYVFTKEELEKLLDDAFDSGAIDAQGNYRDEPHKPEYIQSLFKQ